MVKVKEFRLGVKLRDIVSGFEGVCVGRLEYLNGCVQYLIKPKVQKDGKLEDGYWFDSQQVEQTGDGITIQQRATGGSSKDSPRSFSSDTPKL